MQRRHQQSRLHYRALAARRSIVRSSSWWLVALLVLSALSHLAPTSVQAGEGLTSILTQPVRSGVTLVHDTTEEIAPSVLPQLLDEALAQPDDPFRLLIRREQGDRRADQAVAALGGTIVKDVAGDAFVALVEGRQVPTLAKHAAISYITIDAPMVATGTTAIDYAKLATLYPLTVGAEKVWDKGYTGKGVGVAVLDTGINKLRRDFDDGLGRTSRVIVEQKFNSLTNSMSDGYGHGSHVAGILAGNSWWKTDKAIQGKYLGIAPEANLINVKVSDDEGKAYISDVINAIEWCITHREDYNIRVMTLALRSTVEESYKKSMLDAAVERAWFNGIVVVVAAGNDGPDTMRYPPANDPFAITVGATDPMETASHGDDTIAPWSSYGTTQDGYDKPEVVAPGRYIVSVSASGGSTLTKRYPERIVDGDYLWLSGTSMAAPVVAGIAALAFEAHPEWTNDQVKWLLMETAKDLGTKDKHDEIIERYPGQGAGEVDAKNVVSYGETPGWANQGTPISSQLEGPDGKTNYDRALESSATWSTSSWSTATWSTSADLESTSSWSTSSWSTNAD